MKIAAIQMEIDDGNPLKNQVRLEKILNRLIDVDLCLIPELWTSGYSKNLWNDMADNNTPQMLKWMSFQAKNREINLGGTIVSRNKDGKLVNRFFLFNKKGEQVCHYDKAHLFLPLGECDFFVAGKIPPPIIEIEGMRVAPAICYDLRFPEMFRKLALLGVDLFLVPSEWPTSRINTYKILSEARAIENQSFLVTSNRIGTDSSGTEFGGQSGIYGPLGPLAIAQKSSDTFIEVSISQNELKLAREALLVFQDRIQGIDH